MKSFNITRKGYDTQEVEEYILDLENRLAAAQAKINSYQGKEEAITQAVISAQLQAAEIIAGARKTSEDIIADAKKDAANLRTNALEEMSSIREQVLSMSEKLGGFQQEYDALIQKYLVGLRCEELTRIFGELESFMKALEIPTEEK